MNIRKMYKKAIKNKGKVFLICLLCLAGAGCGGPSGEQIAAVQGTYADLISLHNEVVEAYADLEDDSFGKQLDAMADKMDSIGQRDTQGMTAEELDAVAAEMAAYKETYDEMLAEIQEMKDGEQGEKIYEVPVAIENNTGVLIHSLYLYKAGDTEKGENLVGDAGCLEGFQTLNILNLYMTQDEMLWHLEAAEESGKVIESVDIDFTDKAEDGVTIVMKFSFDSMEGWVEFK